MTGGAAFFLDRAALRARAEALCAGFANATPFPHAVIDDFLPAHVLDAVLAEFPRPDADAWLRYRDPDQCKLGSPRIESLGPACRRLLAELNSSALCEFLERLSGIRGIVPDPHFAGGGLHQIVRGGYLKIHADFNWHRRLRLHRRLNLLLYLNREWREEYGGHLELWDAQMRRCEQRILPIFNRCVVFATSSTSYHGHPDPLTCPQDRARRSVALYYYTRRRPARELRAPHSTLFRMRPGEIRVGGGKVLERGGALLKRFLPPLLAQGVRGLTSRSTRGARRDG